MFSVEILIFFGYSSQIFLPEQEFNYGVEFVLLISVTEHALDDAVEDALAALRALIDKFSWLIVQATHGISAAVFGLRSCRALISLLRPCQVLTSAWEAASTPTGRSYASPPVRTQSILSPLSIPLLRLVCACSRTGPLASAAEALESFRGCSDYKEVSPSRPISASVAACAHCEGELHWVGLGWVSSWADVEGEAAAGDEEGAGRALRGGSCGHRRDVKCPPPTPLSLYVYHHPFSLLSHLIRQETMAAEAIALLYCCPLPLSLSPPAQIPMPNPIQAPR